MINVIHDGNCRFCRACLNWLELKLKVTKLAYQEIDTTRFGITKEQCSTQVYVEIQGEVFAGATAIAKLLDARGNRILPQLIRRSGPLAHIGYRWVATHRNSWIIKGVTKIIERRSARA